MLKLPVANICDVAAHVRIFKFWYAPIYYSECGYIRRRVLIGSGKYN